MTGPEHYREGEKRVTAARAEMDPQWALVQAQLAIAEATLALAAATALNDNSADEGGMPLADYHAWAEAAGVWKPKPKGQTA
ncbi:hypothetical protein L0F81_23715 [Streptomyces tricolor]|uniref:Uncharacterized protein n=1 Tax=Streptomyces tricolor TaxID=68277 RepID=A0ABS9JL23_9ACTN|nr:hypothetical protein [Streptomyces tricolor]MCG0066261.1 hypothetical protein [Streptomyces tricolor]